jgi:hypothetical protein
MPINSKQKGSAYERKIMNEVKKWWPNAMTTRYGSLYLDVVLGIDIMNTPGYSIQCKAVEQSLNTHRILKEMPQDENINVVFHKRNRQGETVTMMKEDFYKLLDNKK